MTKTSHIPIYISRSALHFNLTNPSSFFTSTSWAAGLIRILRYYGRTLSLIAAVYGTCACFKSAIKTFFDSLLLSFSVTAFSNLVKRWKYVVDSAGDYCPDKLEE